MKSDYQIVLVSRLCPPAEPIDAERDPIRVQKLTREMLMSGALGVVTAFRRRNDELETITGEPLRLAAILADLTRIPVRFYDGDTTAPTLLLLRLRDKETRARMNACDLGRHYSTIIQAKQWCRKQLAKHLGINECLVAKPLSIITHLCPELQRRHANREIPAEEAYYLSRLPSHRQQLDLAAKLPSISRAMLKAAVNLLLRPPDTDSTSVGAPTWSALTRTT